VKNSRDLTLLALVLTLGALAACTKNSDGDMVVKTPVVETSTRTDTVHTPRVELSKDTITTVTPTVVVKKETSTVTVPHVSVTRKKP
jgi:uncharacterized protein YcfL